MTAATQRKTVLIVGGQTRNVPEWMREKYDLIHFQNSGGRTSTDVLPYDVIKNQKDVDIVVGLRFASHAMTSSGNQYARENDIPYIYGSGWANVAGIASRRQDARWLYEDFIEATQNTKPKGSKAKEKELEKDIHETYRYHSSDRLEVLSQVLLFGPTSLKQIQQSVLIDADKTKQYLEEFRQEGWLIKFDSLWDVTDTRRVYNILNQDRQLSVSLEEVRLSRAQSGAVKTKKKRKEDAIGVVNSVESYGFSKMGYYIMNLIFQLGPSTPSQIHEYIDNGKQYYYVFPREVRNGNLVRIDGEDDNHALYDIKNPKEAYQKLKKDRENLGMELEFDLEDIERFSTDEASTEVQEDQTVEPEPEKVSEVVKEFSSLKDSIMDAIEGVVDSQLQQLVTENRKLRQENKRLLSKVETAAELLTDLNSFMADDE